MPRVSFWGLAGFSFSIPFAAALALIILIINVTAEDKGLSDTTKIVLIQDAGIDDYFSAVLLAKAPNTQGRYVGEIVVNADSSLPDSIEAASMLHHALDIQIPLGLSRARMFNAFPWEYRSDAIKFRSLPSLNAFNSTIGGWPYPDADEWLEEFLAKEADHSVDIALTTASTTLTDLWRRRPELATKVRRVLWMAGAVWTAGNLDPKQYDWRNTKAEWNAFADPESGASLLDWSEKAGFDILLFPLDISDQLPIAGEFIEELQAALAKSKPGTPDHTLRQIAYDAYSLTTNEPFYRLWDVVTVGYLQWPELYATPHVVPMTMEVDPKKQAGWTRICSTGEKCPTVQVYTNFTSEAARQQFIRNVATV